MQIKQAILQSEKQAVVDFLATFDLKFNNTADYTAYVEVDDKIVATISLAKNLICDLAVSNHLQGENLATLLISHAVAVLRENKIYGYKVEGYTSVINSVETFYKTNMDLLCKDVRMELFMGKNPILTRIKDSVPTIYGENCNICNSLIADGCTIDGTVENCIIFRDVKIEKGAVVKNSIIMQNTTVKADASLNCVITDKDVIIGDGRLLAGTETMPFIINKGKIV